jgi:hypothetical protein
VVSPTGVEATGEVGTVTQRTTAVIPVVAPNAAVAQIGNVAVTGDSVAQVTGISAVASPGNVLVYGVIIPDVTTIWVEIQP